MKNKMELMKRKVAREFIAKNFDNGLSSTDIDKMTEYMINFNIKTSYYLGQLGILLEKIEECDNSCSCTYFLILPFEYVDVKDENGEIYTRQSAAQYSKKVIIDFIKEYNNAIREYIDSEYKDPEINVAYICTDEEWTEEKRKEFADSFKKEVLEDYGVEL